MTDEEFVLIQDNKERKDIAQKYKHTPRRTRYRMDSDKLTEAQRRALNGPVVAYNLEAPMTWAKFKSLPEASQRLYLSSLIERYGARDSMLAEMFGVVPTCVGNMRRRLGIKAFGKKAPGETVWKRWKEFLAENRTPAPEADVPAIPEPVVTPEPEVAPEPVKEAAPAASWDELFRLAKLLGEQYGLRVRIEVTT